ncbi:MAG: Hsp70 family protein [Solobacterium sp.]|nr:Hsp70 family protein [Solobacterium sp.]
MRIGIDFGTCFSLPALQSDDRTVFLLPPGVYGIPSLFYYDEWEGIQTGEAANKAGQGTDAVNLKRAVKLSLPSTFTADGKTFTGKQMAAAILAGVVSQAQSIARTKLITEPIDEAVISVPAAFTQAEKRILREAAETPVKDGGPGIKVIGFIKEPVAAALSYFRDSMKDHTRILVYDLGGGTFDIAIVEADSRLREKYTVIDSATLRIGGNDWDARIEEYLASMLEKECGFAVSNDPGHMEKIRREANSVKHAFSENICGAFPQRVRARIEVNGRNHNIPMTSQMFDELTGELFRKTVKETKRLLDANKDQPVQDIICVGGSTNMPQVQNGLKSEFPDKNVHFYEPEKAVASGAAIYAEYCDGKEPYLTDIAAFSYGTDCYPDFENDPTRRVIINLVRRGQRLPVSSTDRFRTAVNNQRHMYFDIFETEQDVREYDYKDRVRPILSAELELPAGLAKGTLCKLDMTLNKDGLLEICASYGNDLRSEASLYLYDDNGTHI